MLGFPIRINVGGRALKENNIEIVTRRDRKLRAVPRQEAVAAVREVRRQLAGGG
ncbi:MAG: His/Gly/Thr/Pro-type tRNA ligase C-terminal domain-containing protein [Thermoanaerobaculia bacterium]